MANDIPPLPPTHSSQPGEGGTRSGPQAPPAPGRKGPLALLICGLVAGFVGLVVTGFGIGLGVDRALSAGSEQQALESETSYTLDVEPDSRLGIYTVGSGSVRCYAESADGVPLSIDVPSSHQVINGRERVLIISTGTSDTTMSLTCETDDGADYFLGKTVSGQMHGVVLPIIIGPILTIVGLMLTIAGVIWLVVRHSRTQQSQAQIP